MVENLYKKYCINKLKNKLQDNIIKEIYRNNDKHFIRNRKMNFEKVILYGLNKRGLTSKMEIEDFTELINMTDISSPAVLKQRLKLNGKIYLDMMQENLKGFYEEFKDEVKLFNGYILSAIDGSDFEIPNTKLARAKYNELHQEETVARATISNMFDVLNHYIMDTVINKYDFSERKMAQENYNNVKKLELPYPIIRTMDRGYGSIVDMYYSNKSNDKYVVRLKKSDFKKQIQNMKSNDEIIKILKETEVSFVQLSIDGNPGMHDSLRAPGDYDRTMNKARQLEKNGIKTYISFTANKENMRYIPYVAKECRKRKITKLWSDRLVPIGNGEEMQRLSITRDEMPRYIRYMKNRYCAII